MLYAGRHEASFLRSFVRSLPLARRRSALVLVLARAVVIVAVLVVVAAVVQ